MLTDTSILPVYSTNKNDIANEFYIPVLIESISYDRVTGYFSAKSLANFSKGLEGLYLNRGHYRLIISNQISKEDFQMMTDGYDSRKTNKDYIKKDYQILKYLEI